jgi:hypothetical protein
MVRPSKILALASLLAVIHLGCGRTPARPAGLPPEAVWGGEGRRGVFLKVGGHQGTLWRLDVWDREGRLLGSGSFRLRGFGKATIVPEEVLAWENGALHLKDGTWLVPEPAAAP